MDVAVSRDAEGLARALEAAGFGRAVEISDARPRVFRVAGRRALDLAEVEGGSIQQDLGRRDFTANAMAIELETGRWIDPFGGAADLADRQLRLVHSDNMADDPVRSFRAARFYATHGLRPDRAVREACVQAAPRLAGVAPERIQTELAKMLEADRVARAFAWAASAGLLTPALGIRAPSGRWRAAARSLARLEGRGRLPASLDSRRRLRLSLIASGLGLSPQAAAEWLRRGRHGRSEAGGVKRLLELAEAARKSCSPRARWGWIHDAGAALPEALLFIQIAHPRLSELVHGLKVLASRGRKGPTVTGSDLMVWLAETPGPLIGRLLREVQIEALRGKIRTRRDARRWLTGRDGRAARGQLPKFLRPNDKEA